MNFRSLRCASFAALCLIFAGAAQSQTTGFHSSTLGTQSVGSTVTYYDGSNGSLFTAVNLPTGASV